MKTLGLSCALGMLALFIVFSQTQAQAGSDASDTLELKSELVQINDSLSEIVDLLQHLVSGQKGSVLVERVAIEERSIASLETQILALEKERVSLLTSIYNRRKRLESLAGQEARLVEEEVVGLVAEAEEKEQQLRELASTLQEHEAVKFRVIKKLDEYLELPNN